MISKTLHLDQAHRFRPDRGRSCENSTVYRLFRGASAGVVGVSCDEDRRRPERGGGLFAGSGHDALEKTRRRWSPEDFRRYAFRCADIEARSYRRKCHRLGKRIVYLAPDVIQALGNETQEQIAADPVPSRRRLDALRLCLDGLDPVQRELLDARYEKAGAGKSVADIAKERGCKMEALYKRLERIRTSLQSCILKRLKELHT